MSKTVQHFIDFVKLLSKHPVEELKLQIGRQKMINVNDLLVEIFELNDISYVNVEALAQDLANVVSSNDTIIRTRTKDIDMQRIIDRLLSYDFYPNPLIINDRLFCEPRLAGDFLWSYRNESFNKWIHDNPDFCFDAYGFLYVFAGIEKDTNKPVLKIGRSNDIERRFGNHRQKIDIKLVCYRKTDCMKNGEACLKAFLQKLSPQPFVQKGEWYYFEDYDTLDKFMREHMIREVENAALVRSQNCCLSKRAILPDKVIKIEEYKKRDVEDCLKETFAKWETEII